ncbi:MAG: aminotransferase class V-fold PLP-dependent enzyme [Candidatus Aminicenantes bacterium]|nr:aminotransferase class V-fold PLP-dependent enzyme [Candidatus Aminicenantes bacterium]
MGKSRRQFFKEIGLGIGSIGIFGFLNKDAQAGLKSKLKQVQSLPAKHIAQDEDFWFYVQQAFNIDRSFINLNNGGVHPAPKIVIDAVKRYMDFSNGAPAHNSWRVLRHRKELIRKRLADTFGCSPEEIAITRNVTESMQIALLGLELKSGDEVLTSTHDYPSMKNALYQRKLREGIKVNTFSFPYPPKNLNVLTELVEQNITPKTKLILLCHITNLTGQIFPLKDICHLARNRNIEVVVDGAHSFGHFVYKQKDIDTDIYGANLHKWMMGPIGTGFLYVKKEKIKKIWPLFPASDPKSDDIRKFEHVGTQPEALKLAVGDALTFHHGIGEKRKEERLRFLRNYWAKEIEQLPGVKILTPYAPEQSCGIGTFSLENRDIKELQRQLLNKLKVYTINVGVPSEKKGEKAVMGLRVTPSIYTTLRELDIFIDGVKGFVKNGSVS